MNVRNVFPLRFLLNRGREDEHLIESQLELNEVGVPAERRAAIDPKRAGNRRKAAAPVRGYPNLAAYCSALTIRLALREARRRGAEAVLLIEDNIAFHPNFQTLISAAELPADWGLFYLGCAHRERPTVVEARMVRVVRSSHASAIGIRASCFGVAMKALDRHSATAPAAESEAEPFLNSLEQHLPVYSCYPDLAWRRRSEIGATRPGKPLSRPDDFREQAAEAIPELLGEMLGLAPQPLLQKAKLALLFLTRGDVNHPEIWREFVAEAPDRVKLFCHPKHPEQIGRGFLDGSAIRAHFETEWGDIGLVRATRALLLEALEDESLTHFALVSESCVPVKPLLEVLRRLDLDPRPQFDFRTLDQAVAGQRSRANPLIPVPRGCWHFQSQWWLLDRVSACMAAWQDFTGLFEKVEVPDENYFATVLCMQGYPLQDCVLKEPITWTSWENSAGSPNEWNQLPERVARKILHSPAWFARKFPPGADVGRYGLHRSACVESPVTQGQLSEAPQFPLRKS